MGRIAVMIVDDHPLIRLGLRQALGGAPDIEIVAEASTGVDALRLLDDTGVDVVVLDLARPGRRGVEILRRLCARPAPPPVLIYSRFPEEQYAVRCLRAGAVGYVMKDSPPQELSTAIRRVAAGGRHVSRRVAALLGERGQAPLAAPHDALSEREFEVFRMIVGGKTVSQIAAELSLSVKTISTHRTRILHKLNLTGTADLVHYAIEHGIDEAAS